MIGLVWGRPAAHRKPGLGAVYSVIAQQEAKARIAASQPPKADNEAVSKLH
ncbi:MAG TPA: hypothetical protein VHN79_01710 [Lacunisphaera sp.]|nr:hypothetical protein [Lacunisphaera sp.]